MPCGPNFPHTYLTSRVQAGIDQRTTPVGALDGANVAVLVDGAAVGVWVDGERVRLALMPIPEPGSVYLGESADGQSIWALERPDSAPADVQLLPARTAGPLLSEREANLALAAVGMAAWHRDYRHCPACAAPLAPEKDGWMLRCAAGHLQFPRTDPAVIVAITDADDRLLLAHNRRSHTAMVSVLAGFVEPGEDFESALVREVFEEVGLVVTDPEYRGSQPWPFPRSIMVGFRARVAPGVDADALVLQAEEITSARWYTRSQFRAARADGSLVIPDPASIARALIDEWDAADGERAAPVAGAGFSPDAEAETGQ